MRSELRHCYDRVNRLPETINEGRCSHTDRSALCVSDTTTGICLDICYLVGALAPIWLFKLRLLSPSGLLQQSCKHLWYPIASHRREGMFSTSKTQKPHSYIAQGKFRFTAHPWHTWLSLLSSLYFFIEMPQTRSVKVQSSNRKSCKPHRKG
jgi:hypothetical protein